MDDRGVHNLYKNLVNSGHAFGAKRWVATLERQCERLASVMATNVPTADLGGNVNISVILKAYTVLNIHKLVHIYTYLYMCVYISNFKSRREKEYAETGRKNGE